LRARANSASSHGYVQNESHAVFFFYKIENERNAFSRLMGMELPLTNCFKLFVPSLPWQIDRLSMPQSHQRSLILSAFSSRAATWRPGGGGGGD
jgi:hypothetical protein